MISARHVLVAAAALLVSSCEPSSHLVRPYFGVNTQTASAAAGGPGAVYLTSNDAGGNEILVFVRASDGRLTAAGKVPTGGLGTSQGLGNQLAMALTPDHRRLYVVNAGSNDITGFVVTDAGLAADGDLLYVLNAGNGGNISGFRIVKDGALSPIPGSSRPLSGGNTGPAQIQFNPHGDVLVVTEKSTNSVTTYVVGADGRAGPPHTTPSPGQTPFGFNFNQRGDLVVSEAGGSGNGLSTASSYRVGGDGVLTLVTGAVETTQAAACWIAIGQNGRHAYTTNTGSGTVSELAIGVGASLSLEDAVAGVTGPNSQPQDADFTPGGRYLYVRNAGGSVSGFRVEGDGALEPIGVFGPIPTFASGIVAR
jgi:6-phosphogluconolactonase